MLPVLAGCSDPPANSGSQTLPVLETITVHTETAPREYSFDGVIEAVNQSTVSAQTGGRVAELAFDVGDYVPKAAVIVRLRGKEPQARQQQAIATMNEARAVFNEAQTYHQRATTLFAQKMLSQSEMDQVSANYEKSKARYEATRAAADEAEALLEYTTIVAPYAGVVTQRHVEIGETVSPGMPLMSGFSLENLRVTVDVPQRQIAALREHRQARIILPDKLSVAAGALTIFPYADPQTHTVKVRVELPDAGQAVYPGMLVKVVFVAVLQTILAVPRESITQRSEVTGIYVLRTGDAGPLLEFRQIRVGSPMADGRVPVLAGISSGEQIVVDPVLAASVLKTRQTSGSE
jgi:RND family efflux transporter MFP subunit